MKKLIAICFVLFFAAAFHAVPSFAAANDLTISTDKKEYKPGESVVIKGEVKQNGKSLPQADVTLKLEYAGGIVQVDQTQSTDKGYSFIIGLNNEAKYGDYKIVVQALGVKKELTFKVSQAVFPTKPAPLPKNKIITYKNPKVVKGEVMISYTTLLKDLGATFKYDKAKKTITAKKGKTTIVLTIGKTTAKVNGVSKKMAAAPYSSNSKFYLPASFISKTF